jgi:hypothetical protein
MFKKRWLKAVSIIALITNGFIFSSITHAEDVTIGPALTTFDAYLTSNSAYSVFNYELRRQYVNGKLAWCIELPTLTIPGSGYSSTPSYSVRMNLITAMASDLGAATNDVVYSAAQKMLHGEVGWTYSSAAPITLIQMDAQINTINDRINQWHTKPSFDGQTVKVKYGESVTLTDTNNVLSGYSTLGANTGSVNYSISGNKLTITPKDTTKANGTLGLTRPRIYGTPLIWDKPDSQTLITQGDPTNAVFAVNLDIELMGNVTIQKLDKTFNTAVAGTKYHVTFSDGRTAQDVTTGTDGKVTIKDITSGVEVTAVETSVPKPYTLNVTPFKGTIKAGETITITQKNVLQPKMPRTGSNRTLTIYLTMLLISFLTAICGFIYYVKQFRRFYEKDN